MRITGCQIFGFVVGVSMAFSFAVTTTLYNINKVRLFVESSKKRSRKNKIEET